MDVAGQLLCHTCLVTLVTLVTWSLPGPGPGLVMTGEIQVLSLVSGVKSTHIQIQCQWCGMLH